MYIYMYIHMYVCIYIYIERERERVYMCVCLYIYMSVCGPDSSVCIATDYRMEGPGSNPSGDEIFRPSGPALGPTQAPVQWVPGLSRG